MHVIFPFTKKGIVIEKCISKRKKLLKCLCKNAIEKIVSYLANKEMKGNPVLGLRRMCLVVKAVIFHLLQRKRESSCRITQHSGWRDIFNK